MAWEVSSTASDNVFDLLLHHQLSNKGATPYGDFTLPQVLQFLREGKRLKFMRSIQYQALIYKCWHFSPDQRPTATALHDALLEGQASVTDFEETLVNFV